MRNLVNELLAHYPDLRRYLARELKDPHRAADIAQSSFERIYASATRTMPPHTIDSPRALLFRVARNLCIDESRRRKHERAWVQASAAQSTQPLAQSSEYVVAQRRVLARIVATLEQLPPRRRQVFLLFRAYGYSRAEIAEHLHITDMAVAKHLLRAIQDCSRVFAEMRRELIEPQFVGDAVDADSVPLDDAA